MNKLKKAFLLLILLTTFVFFVYSVVVFLSHGFRWGDLLITTREFYNHIIWFALKLIVVITTVATVRRFWY